MHAKLLGIAVLCFANAFAGASASDTVVIASVNGYPVRAGELRLAMARQRAGVLDSLARPDLSPAGIDPRTVETVTRRKAFDECVSIKVEQILMLEQGMTDDIDFATLQWQRVEENLVRKRIAAQGGVVYGPVEYDEDSYLRYILGNLRIRLKEKMVAGMSIPESELRARYEGEARLFTREPTIDIVFLRVRDATLQTGEAAARALRPALLNGDNCLNVKIPTARGQALSVACDTLHLDESLQAARISVGRLEAALLVEKSRSLEEGSVSPVFEFDGGIGAVKCIRKGAPSRMSFAEARDRIRGIIISDRYLALVAGRRTSAQVITVTETTKRPLSRVAGR